MFSSISRASIVVSFIINRNSGLHRNDCVDRDVVVTLYRVRRIAINFLLEPSVRKLNIMFADRRRFESTAEEYGTCRSCNGNIEQDLRSVRC